jgi:hypothetical protein
MTRLFLALIALLAFGGISQAQPTSWDTSYVPGGMDGNGHFMGGTEIRELIPWNPGKPDAKLYAANSYWEDTPGPEGKQTAQVLFLTSSHGFWQQDVNFGSFCPPATPKCALATSTLDKLSFSSDKNGAPVSVQVLVASTWDIRAAPKPSNVYAKNNTDGLWYETVLGTVDSKDEGAPQVRSFATHVDKVTGQDWAFAGEAPTGIFHGLLSDKRGAGKNIIEWTTGNANVEFRSTSYAGPPCTGRGRPTSFAETGGKLYATICFQIWVRVDGPTSNCNPDQVLTNGECQPRWKALWTDPTPINGSESGLRGLTVVKYEGKDVFLVGEEGGMLKIYRVDPDTAVGFAELDMKNTLVNNWNMDLGYCIAPYNNMRAWDTTGIVRRVIGLECIVKEGTSVPLPGRSFVMLEQGTKAEGTGFFLVRNNPVSYELVRVPADLESTPLEAVRATVPSPFADECNPQGKDCAIYVGGFDGNKSALATPCSVAPCTFPPLVPINTHNTAWIVKGLNPKF